MQGGRRAQGARAARRRLRHGPRRHRQPLDPVPEREQLGAGHRRVHAGRRSTTSTGTSARSRPARCCKTVRARDLFRQIAAAAWECADPGMQFDTTINRWHTAANTGRINGSNPCFTATLACTPTRASSGSLSSSTACEPRRGRSASTRTTSRTPTRPPTQVESRTPEAFMITGRNEIVRLRFDNGMELRCTPGHKVFTANRGYVEAQDLTADDQVQARSTSRRRPSAADWAAPGLARSSALPPDGRSRRASCALPDDVERGARVTTSDGSSATGASAGDDDRDDLRVSGRPHRDPSGRTPSCCTWINGGSSDQALRAGERHRAAPPQPRVSSSSSSRRSASRRWRASTRRCRGRSSRRRPTIVAAFLRGLFDADGTAVVNPAKGSYVGLGSISVELLRGVQRLLTTFGVSSRIYETSTAAARRSLPGSDGTPTEYTRRPQLRPAHHLWLDRALRRATIGFGSEREGRPPR